MTYDDLLSTQIAKRERESTVKHTEARGKERERNAPRTYRVINTPHKHAEQRLVRAEQFNLLVLYSKMFLLQLAEPAGH